jgi:hypothetical protein|nr:MAG TPA: hypothetical protein [Caudoviricetes sp.]
MIKILNDLSKLDNRKIFYNLNLLKDKDLKDLIDNIDVKKYENIFYIVKEMRRNNERKKRI